MAKPRFKTEFVHLAVRHLLNESFGYATDLEGLVKGTGYGRIAQARASLVALDTITFHQELNKLLEKNWCASPNELEIGCALAIYKSNDFQSAFVKNGIDILVAFCDDSPEGVASLLGVAECSLTPFGHSVRSATLALKSLNPVVWKEAVQKLVLPLTAFERYARWSTDKRFIGSKDVFHLQPLSDRFDVAASAASKQEVLDVVQKLCEPSDNGTSVIEKVFAGPAPESLQMLCRFLATCASRLDAMDKQMLFKAVQAAQVSDAYVQLTKENTVAADVRQLIDALKLE